MKPPSATTTAPKTAGAVPKRRRRKKTGAQALAQAVPDAEAFAPLDPEKYSRTVGRIMGDVRKRVRSLSLHAAARLSGVSRHYWREVEAGEKSVTARTKMKMCNALRIHPSKIDAIAETWLKR